MIKFKKIKNNIKDILKKINSLWKKLINMKIIKQIFLFLPHNIFLFLMFIICLFLIASFSQNRTIPIYVQNVSDGVFDMSLTEDFVIPLSDIEKDKIEWEKSIDNICFTFATHGRKTDSLYNYKLVKNNEVVYENKFNSNILKDQAIHCFPLIDVTKENMEEYTVFIEPINVDEENMITIFKNTKSSLATMRLTSNESFLSTSEYIILLSIFLIINFGIHFLINTKKIKVEKMWLLFSILYLIPVLFLNPPYEVPDEPIHFYNAYRFTQYDKNKSFYENMSDHYLNFPEDISCIGYANIQKKDKLTDRETIKNCFKNTDQIINKKVGYPFLETRLAFLPAAIGIKIADIFTNSTALIFYMGRLFSALLSIFIIYKAIKITPKYKELFLLVATIPMFVQQMNSYSHDALLNSISLLLVALVLKMIYDKSYKFLPMTILLLLCGLFIAHIKSLYLTLFLLLLFVPNTKFKNKSHKYLYTFLIIFLSSLLGKSSKLIFADVLEIENILGPLMMFIATLFMFKFIFSEKKPKIIEIIIFLVFALFSCYYKAIYMVILLVLSAFISLDKFKSKKRKIILMGSILILSLVAIGFKNYSVSLLDVSLEEKIVHRSTMRLHDLMTHPQKIITLAYYTLRLNTMEYFRGIIGYFGWFTYRMNDIFIYAYLFIIIYLLSHYEFIKTKLSYKFIFGITMALSIAGVFLAMYLYWSNTDLSYIDGVQGRYFMPLILPILLIFITSKKKQEIDLTTMTYSFISLVLLNYICLVISFFY